MTAVLRVGVARLCNSLPLLNVQSAVPAALSQKCNISGRMMRGGPRVPLAPPFPYKTKKYGLITSIYDKTSKRFDENSKIIVVEGPIAVGKTKFAQELAEELDMLYVPAATMDMMYINSYGYDMRQLDPQLPDCCKSFDTKNFCHDPKNVLTASFQLRLYQLRFEQYFDALTHILSTGQGIVLERCVYSDMVFLEAMVKHGYVSKGAQSVYYEIRENTIGELLKPHLVIYLDCPVDEVKKRIKARNLDYEVNSPVFTDAYLKDMETLYKQRFLKDISTHAEILIYDWTAGGETEVVVEDIERIDFDQFELNPYNKKMLDWRFHKEQEWADARMKYSNDKVFVMNYFNVPRYDVPELLRDAESSKIFRDLWFSAPGMKYDHGYNAEMGDTNILTKNILPRRWLL